MTRKLKEMKIIDTNNAEKFIEKTVCRTDSKNCMYGTCNECKNQKIIQCDCDKDELTWIYSWETSQFQWESTKSQKIEVSKKTARVRVNLTVGELLKRFSENLVSFRKHVYNIRHQYREIRMLKDSLKDTERSCVYIAHRFFRELEHKIPFRDTGMQLWSFQ